LYTQNEDLELLEDGVTDLALAAQREGGAPLSTALADEHVWVESARGGDIDAFDRIMERYEDRLLRFLVGLVGDVELARELCQDTFLAAYQALPKLRGELRLSAWLHTIALNRARSHHRKWHNRRTVPLQDDILPARGGDMQEIAVTQDSVRRTLELLPKHYKEALLLQTAGMSCREIARAVGSSEGAVKVRLLRARDAFRRLYEAEVSESCRS